VENAARVHGSTDGPPGLCRLARDDRVQVQEMSCHGLNRLRRILAVMLHAIRIAEEGVERQCIAACWSRHDAVGNSRVREQVSNVSLSASYRPTKQRAQQPADAPMYRCAGLCDAHTDPLRLSIQRPSYDAASRWATRAP
jgi:hypothetical protein